MERDQVRIRNYRYSISHSWHYAFRFNGSVTYGPKWSMDHVLVDGSIPSEGNMFFTDNMHCLVVRMVGDSIDYPLHPIILNKIFLWSTLKFLLNICEAKVIR
jgi:hypothetical protein